MNRLATTCLLALLAAGGACKKDEVSTPTATPEDVASLGDGAAEAGPTDPPQDPDPPELRAAFEAYLRGDPEAAVAALDPVLGTWEGDGRIRARAMGHALLALARAEDVVEQAEPHARAASEEAAKLHDPEVTAHARLAEGVFALGVEHFDDAVAALEAAASAEAPAELRALAQILLGQARIGRAYGPGGGSKLLHPEDLDAARAAYEAALALADGTPTAALLEGRAHEGLAAVAKYKGEHEALCEHAAKASERLAAAEATERLREGPRLLAEAGRCEGAGG
ncbi:MAG: hypothetical protein D6705_13710 [Deltaproteobacteria bacterium]|nr:MAG: hypothetical protein D6705_13710 [Deltaproteobacteria bacterium]